MVKPIEGRDQNFKRSKSDSDFNNPLPKKGEREEHFSDIITISEEAWRALADNGDPDESSQKITTYHNLNNLP